jgi:hypothetical protein
MKGANELGCKPRSWKLRLLNTLEKLRAEAAEESSKYSLMVGTAQASNQWYYLGKREAFMELLVMLREGKIQ